MDALTYSRSRWGYGPLLLRLLFLSLFFSAGLNPVVAYAVVQGTAGRQELTAGVVLTNQNSLGLFYFVNMIFTCGSENANISIEVPESESSGTAGAFTGTLSLMLIPD